MANILKNADIVDCWLTSSSNNKTSVIYKFVKHKIDGLNFNKKKLMKSISFFDSKMKKCWKDSKYNKKTFEKKHSKWLSYTFFDLDKEPSTSLQNVGAGNLTAYTSDVDITMDSESGATNIEIEAPETSKSRGRPTKVFNQATIKTKNRRVADIIKKYSLEELEYAVNKLKRKTNSVSESQNTNIKCLPVAKALALYMDLDLSERKYIVLREAINELHPNCLPSLYALQTEKKKLVPPVRVTEFSAEVDLKTLMRGTAESICELCDVQDKTCKLSLICKWGMDGSSGHSRYKQKFKNETLTDEFMFFIAFVPLRMVNLTSKEVLWVNKTPSSTLFCRPIKLLLEKENAVLVQKIYREIGESIENLECDVIERKGAIMEVKYDMHCTMIDGAVANILSATNATSRCFICNASPTEMNDINTLKIPNVDNYKYGLSTLHCWIKFFECLIHIAYRLSFKLWRVGKENKEQFLENKKRIQNQFKRKTGLIIDQVKHGFGNTNDGNTARRFFSNCAVAAEITGIDEGLIENFGIILRVLSCGSPINVNRFKDLLTITRNMYLIHYGWYYMPSTVHKILVHGCDVIKYFNLPIGCLSEEALEANHKNLRRVRLSHTRKTSREDTNKDLMTYMLLHSDPALSTNRNIKTKHKFVSADIEKYIQKENVDLEYGVVEQDELSSSLCEIWSSEDSSSYDDT